MSQVVPRGGQVTHHTRIALAGLIGAWLVLPSAWADDQLERGEYLLYAGGCVSCHTVRVKDKATGKETRGPLLAGGGPIKMPFGTFYAPNITPDPEYGIGRWQDDDFIRALRQGRAPDGEHYYPAFPYPAFTGMTDADMRAIKAYIFTLPPVAQPSRRHDLRFPFNLRFGIWLWKALYFEPGPLKPDKGMSARWNRGAYLVRAVTHCGE